MDSSVPFVQQPRVAVQTKYVKGAIACGIVFTLVGSVALWQHSQRVAPAAVDLWDSNWVVQDHQAIQTLQAQVARDRQTTHDLQAEVARDHQTIHDLQAEVASLGVPSGISSGSLVHFQNEYDGTHRYLDVCGGASCGGGFGVVASDSSNRDTNSGTWAITKVNGGGVIHDGDWVHLQNEYDGTHRYLDVCGGASCGGGFEVVASDSSNRDSHSGTWVITKVTGSGVILPGDLVHLQNEYDGTHRYLDVCGGASCGGGFDVVASDSSNRDTNSGTWAITKV